jgi:hypothetical protein
MRAIAAHRSDALDGASPKMDPQVATLATHEAVSAAATILCQGALLTLIPSAEPLQRNSAAQVLAEQLPDSSLAIPPGWQKSAQEVAASASQLIIDGFSSLSPPAAAIRLVMMYEQLGAADFAGRDARDGYTRRSLGAYYTPPTLADAAALRALRLLFKERTGQMAPPTKEAEWATFVTSLRIADLASGAGQFLLAPLRTIGKALDHFSPDARTELSCKAVSSLEATDLDATALQVLRVAAALTVAEPAALRTSPTIRHGNALLVRQLFAEEDSPDIRSSPVVALPYDSRLALDLASNTPVDLVIGNPPWERIRFEERAFLSVLANDVATLPAKVERVEAASHIAQSNPKLHAYAQASRAAILAAQRAIRSNSLFTYSSRGELYTHALFTELAAARTASTPGSPGGSVALLVKSTFVSSAGHRPLMNALLSAGRVREFWQFSNMERLFAIDSRERFGLLILGGRNSPDEPALASGLLSAEQLGDETRLVKLTNPLRRALSAGGLPASLVSTDIGLVSRLAETNVPFEHAFPEAHFGRLLHLTAHSQNIHREPGGDRLPVWEGRMIEQFNSRYSTWDRIPQAERWKAKTKASIVRDDELADPLYRPAARWFVDRDLWDRVSLRHRAPFSLVWRNASSPSNRRSMIASILPRLPTPQSIQLLQTPDPTELLLLVALVNSLPFDWLIRRQMPGIDVTGTIVRHTLVPSPLQWLEIVDFQNCTAPLRDHVSTRAGTLMADNGALWPLLQDSLGTVPATPDRDGRRRIRRELDVLVGYAYGVDGVALAGVAEDMPRDTSELERTMLANDGFGRVGSPRAATMSAPSRLT